MDGNGCCPNRVQVAGKFFSLNGRKWIGKGFAYGPFAPNRDALPLPERPKMAQDFAIMRNLGANLLRVYHVPPRWVLDEALEYGLRILVDVPWDKHRCFFEDYNAQQEARERVRSLAKELGDHPGLFAISVVNEYPNDIVRYYGPQRLEKFTDELMDVVKQEAPKCLTTFVSFPTTEFLMPGRCDFWSFNVYLHDPIKFGRYLDRLQHIAGNAPLLVSEYGVDSFRQGEPSQGEQLREHLALAHRRGVAGTIVFSYTDDWFTGGHAVEDWAFGVTRRDRSPKVSAEVVREVWRTAPNVDASDFPKVSVVVCSYNGAATLQECLASLMELDYPDYEVILVDDGSRDNTPEIAAEFPLVRCIRQENRGLSVARNVGAAAAAGEVIAYTDSDCVADPQWLLYLIQALRETGAAAVGGPNIPPPDDGWVARCIAVSPGGPSHVMLDDQLAEHIPGCNMAFWRDKLLAIDGFDPQFRQAGDDVDVCWRLLDAGEQIAYAPGAMVWHHRRATVRAYLKQQKGYGRSEAMVRFKHPQRYGALGQSRWRGVIYGDGALGLALAPPRIYHGRFGSALFQTIYRGNDYSHWSYVTLLEWHVLALFALALAPLWPALGLIAAAMWCATLGAILGAARRASLPGGAPRWCRWLVAALHFAQPIVRGWHRQTHLLRCNRAPWLKSRPISHPVKRINGRCWDLYWLNERGKGREALLEALAAEAKRMAWPGDFDDGWAMCDVKLVGDCWHDVLLSAATEELGWPRRFTRVRCHARETFFACTVLLAFGMWLAVAIAAGPLWLSAASALMLAIVWLRLRHSRRRCLQAACALAASAAMMAELCEAEVRQAEPSREEGLEALPVFAAKGAAAAVD